MKIPLSVYDIFGYLVSGFLVLASVEFAFDGDWLLDRDLKPGRVALYLTMAYLIGHIVADFSSRFLEHGFARRILGPSEDLLLKETPVKRGEKGWLWSWLYPSFFKPLPAETRARIMRAAMRDSIDRPGRGLYLHAFTVVKGHDSTKERLATFINLYGFCRNISLSLLTTSLIILISGLSYVYESEHVQKDWDKIGIAVFGGVAALQMFNRYLKFYRAYTQEVLISYPEVRAARATSVNTSVVTSVAETTEDD